MADQIKQLRLSDLSNTKKSISRVIRYLQTASDAELPKYRLINAYMNTLVSCFKMDFEERLAELEKRVEDIKK
jgi:hypothetical protein